jgi:O-antigen/teichoic acid export membrane protein
MNLGKRMSLWLGEYQLGPVVWTLLGTGLSRGSVILANIFVARHVSQVAFGGLGVIQSTVAMLGVLAGFGVGMATTKYVVEMRVRDPRAIGSVLGVTHAAAAVLGSALAIVLFVFAPTIAVCVFGDLRLEPLLRASALLVALSALSSVQTSAIIGFESWVTLAKLGALSGITTLAFVIVGTARYGVMGAIGGLTLAQAATAIVSHITIRRMNEQASKLRSWRFHRSDLRLPFAFGVPALLGTVTFSLADWAAPALIVRQPGGLEQMALFNAANQWMALLIFLPMVIGRTWMPAMCTSLARGARQEVSQLLLRATTLTAAWTVPLLLGVGFYASRVMGLYGVAYRSSGALLVVVLLSGAAMALVKPSEYLVYAAGAVWQNAATCAVYAIVYVAGTLLLLLDGALGLVLARFAGMAIQAVLVYGLARTIISRLSSHSASAD